MVLIHVFYGVAAHSVCASGSEVNKNLPIFVG